MKHLVFVNTPTQRYLESGRQYSYTTIPPYGLGYVATVASKIIGRSNIAFIDGEYLGLSPEKLCQEVLSLQPEFVCLNVTTPNYSLCKEIIKCLGRNLGRKIILGGPHAILRPREILTERNIYRYLLFLATGEGEIPITQFSNGYKIDEIMGIAYIKSNQPVIKPPAELPLDELNSLFIDRRFFKNDPNVWSDGKIKESYLLSSRGCSFNCSFCAAKKISCQRVKLRSEESIKTELEQLLKMGVNYLRFIDDLLFISKKRIAELFNIFSSLGLSYHNFGFEANGRANIMASLEDKYWDMLKTIGFQELEIGIESGSPKILAKMRKGITPDEVIKTVKKAVLYGIKVKGFIIVGYAGEKAEDLAMTVDLVKRLKEIGGSKIRFSPFPAKAYPGTALFEEVKKYADKVNFDEQVEIDLSKSYERKISLVNQKSLFQRTRYNTIQTKAGKPVALSEITGGASLDLVNEVLAKIVLISAGED